MTTKIVALVDALGNLVRFLLMPGQSHDMKGIAPLIKDIRFEALLADLMQSTLDWVLSNDAHKPLSAETNIQETFGHALALG